MNTIASAKKKTSSLFDRIVGQESVKKKLTFFLDCYKTTNTIENLLFQGSQGYGKNLLSETLARQLTVQNSNRIKQYVVVNSSTIKDVASFFESVVDRYLIDSDVCICLDEASEIPKDMQVALLSILDINSEPVNRFDYNGRIYLFPKNRISWIFLSTDSQSLINPLLDRLEVVTLEDYKIGDIIKIIEKQLNYIKTDDGLLEIVAKTLKGNARSAYVIASKIKGYLERKQKYFFEKSDWLDICDRLTIMPLGLNSMEISVLRILNQSPNCSLTKLAAVLGLTSQNVRRFAEIYLLKRNLIEITAKGRNLSNYGREYLRQLDNH